MSKVLKKQTLLRKKQTFLLFSDLHIPYHHPDAFDFLEAVKKEYKPTDVFCLGDLLDNHAISYHESNPDLASPGEELCNSIEYVGILGDLFPKMTILQGNHDILPIRKARTAGLSKRYIRDNAEVFDMPKGWTWKFEETVQMNDGRRLWMRHNLKKNAIDVAEYHDICFTQGHYHEDLKVDWIMRKGMNVFGATVGCLVDDTSLAFEYNKVNIKRPSLGCLVIKNGIPEIVPMLLDRNNKWLGVLSSDRNKEN